MSSPQVTLVVAMAINGVIGREGGLPWRLPADLRQFKADTLGKPVVMGRKTFESIGRLLPGRHNIVLTRQSAASIHPAIPATTAADTRLSVVADWQGVQQAAGVVDEIMVIGGAEIYAMALPFADRILLTRIEAEIEGDTRFPPLDAQEWQETRRQQRPADAENSYPICFLRLDRQTRASTRL